MIVNSWGKSIRVATVFAHVWYQSHTSVSPARVLQLCFKKLFRSEIKVAISAALESGQNTSGASSGAINFDSAKLICGVFMYLIFLSNFPSLAQKIIANTASLELGQRFDSDVILEAAIGVCIHEWSKIQHVNKGVVKRSLIGSSTWVIGPLADLSGFHSIYEIGRRQQKYRPSNAHEIRKYFGN